MKKILETSLPLLNVLLTSTFDSNGGIYGLEVSVAFQADEIEGGTPVSELPLKLKSLYVEKEAEIWDVDGKAPCSGKPSGKGQSWMFERNLHGTITFKYGISPSASKDAKTGVELELHHNQKEGGLLGPGFTFILMPVSANAVNRFHRSTVQWNLDQAPKGTRAVWTFEEEPGPISQIGSVHILSNSVFMVGPIESNPPIPASNSISAITGLAACPQTLRSFKKYTMTFSSR